MSDIDPGLLVFFALIALVVGGFAYKMIKHGGLKAAMFGSSIRRTLGEVEGSGSKMFSVSLRIYELEDSPDKAVGVELVGKSIGSYQMMPVSLSKREAEKLIRLLESATSGSGRST